MSSRIDRYVPLAQAFAARSLLFHDAVASKIGLHSTDLKVLRLLAGQAMTPSELAAHLGLTNAALTAVVDRLENAGFVERTRDEQDRRRITVSVVPAKIRKLDRFYEGQRAEMTKLLSRYSVEEVAAIEDFLERTTKILAAEAAKLGEQ